MCGLCLPHCPTYIVSQHESESPRGRISLVKAYSQGQIMTSPALEEHLQSCTSCLQCERVCPAKVRYEEIIDYGRTQYRKHLSAKIKLLQSACVRLLTQTWGHTLLRTTALLSRNLRISLPSTQLLHQIKPITRESHNNKRAASKQTTIMLFSGCTGELFDQTTMQSAKQLMHALGVDLHLPQKIICCSALAQHSGQLKNAQQQRSNLQAYLEQHKINEVVSFATGCGQQLAHQSTSFTHHDIHYWLSNNNARTKLAFAPLKEKVLVHIPCSMHHDTANVIAMQELLQLIPGINLQTFSDNIACCGAGGMQLLFPHTSNISLKQAKVETIQQIQPDLIVSPNIGCSLQLQRGLEKTEQNITIMHPITLLAKQLEN